MIWYAETMMIAKYFVVQVIVDVKVLHSLVQPMPIVELIAVVPVIHAQTSLLMSLLEELTHAHQIQVPTATVPQCMINIIVFK